MTTGQLHDKLFRDARPSTSASPSADVAGVPAGDAVGPPAVHSDDQHDMDVSFNLRAKVKGYAHGDLRSDNVLLATPLVARGQLPSEWQPGEAGNSQRGVELAGPTET